MEDYDEPRYTVTPTGREGLATIGAPLTGRPTVARVVP
jgi:hypothetical protein